MSEPESLEAALETLEGLVKEMESGDLPLETLIARYESGVKLTKFCRDRLTDAEKRIEIISRDASGTVTLDQFETGSDDR
jgi:exodeoxyribonuclease VII small subunit